MRRRVRVTLTMEVDGIGDTPDNVAYDMQSNVTLRAGYILGTIATSMFFEQAAHEITGLDIISTGGVGKAGQLVGRIELKELIPA